MTHVMLMDLAMVRQWLLAQRVPRRHLDQVIAGIDFLKPVYLRWFDVGESLLQYRDNPSAQWPSGCLASQWFALPSHRHNALGSLGLGSGPAGRTPFVLTVKRRFQALESTAKAMPAQNPNLAIAPRHAGGGGATQVFIPDSGLSCLG
jgi:hypothetical protein